MKVLFFCNTYYQLIVAIRMKLTLKKHDKASVILTDVSKNSEQISKNLQKTGLFESVYHFQVSRNNSKSFLKYLLEGVKGIYPKGMQADLFYDELIGFNYDIPMCALYASLEKVNKAILCNVMEEGLLSYSTPDSDCKVAKLIRVIRKLLFKKNAREKRKNFYCFNKKAYKGPYEPVSIPPINTNDVELKNILFNVFLDGKKPKEYKEKYIYLSSVYDFEGGFPVGELKVAIKIAEIVGYKNLIVKVHPRDSVERFKAAGLQVAENSSIPWEIFQIGCDFTRKVIISSFSGSLINLNSIIENIGTNIYTNKLCNISGNPMAQYFGSIIDGYLGEAETLGLKNITSISAIKQILHKE
ncbi:polysialyltransferase family glycosyltransferase [Flavonifractor sp. An82]|uniref:polysialyltransferase family glycosyltransferase n=1 Tax=Flavonifractor sp. An82 TaxID=1965660 RepID=UPI00111FCFDA|nr:polysialyltransferase family glycosyltransferase [Flavonifractor sp. An82]